MASRRVSRPAHRASSVSAKLRPGFWTLVLIVAFAVLAALLVWPLSSIFTASFIDNTTRAPTLGNYARVIGQPFFQAALGNSLIVGVGGMSGAMLLGIPLAVLTTRYVIVGRDFLATLAVLALVSPPFIGAYAWIMMLGRNGFVCAALFSPSCCRSPISARRRSSAARFACWRRPPTTSSPAKWAAIPV
jgi:ABC-type Fe3+ transport system permease subunit